eukprot:10254-Heterococcus_DN1.PRE.1
MLYNNLAVYTQPRTCKSVMKDDLVCVALAWCCAITAEPRAWACQQCLADKRQAPLQPFCRSGCCKSPHSPCTIQFTARLPCDPLYDTRLSKYDEHRASCG